MNVDSANFLHWLHYLWEDFCSAFRSIKIKLGIIPPTYWKSTSNFKIITSPLFANCECKLLLLIFTSYLQDYDHILKIIPYLSFRWIISRFSLMEFSLLLAPVIWSDWAFGSIFSFNLRQKGLLSLKFSLIFYLWLRL